jgi:hypothetical protein
LISLPAHSCFAGSARHLIFDDYDIRRKTMTTLQRLATVR